MHASADGRVRLGTRNREQDLLQISDRTHNDCLTEGWTPPRVPLLNAGLWADVRDGRGAALSRVAPPD